MKRTVYAKIKGDFYNNLEVYNNLVLAANKSGMTVLNCSKHEFYPQGLTACILLAESHITLHSYPEEEITYLDCFTCGNIDPSIFLNTFCEMMKCYTLSITKIER